MLDPILVPTDFSEVAHNAGKYAVGLAQQLGINKIILYHAWQQPVVMSADVINTELINGEVIEKAAEDNLRIEKESLQSYAGSAVTIESQIDYGQVSSGVEEFCTQNKISFVMMGVTGSGKFDEAFIGSNAVTTAKKTKTPVIILPAEASFSPLRKVMLSCDYRDLDDSLPAATITAVIKEAHAKLSIVHVDLEGSKIEYAAVEKDNKLLADLFEGLNPEFHILHEIDYVEAINKYATNQDIDLIIAIPKKKSFWDSIFKPSRTKQLAFNAIKPLLIINNIED